MLRPFRNMASKCLRWLPQRRLRELRSRPGHFRVRTRSKLWASIPWSKLLTKNSGSAAVVALTALIGYMSVDSPPIGASATEIVLADKRAPDAPPTPEDTSLKLEGEVALMLQIAMLQNAITKLDLVPAYTATFVKEERIEGEMQEETTMHLKLKHEPHSVYFKIEKGGEVGREILFPLSGEDPRLIVKLAKFGGRLPPLKLEPESPLAMKESRYNIRMAGIRELAKLALEIRRHDLSLGNKVQAEARDDAQYDGRPCFAFTTTYANSKAHKDYRKCVIYIDKQLMIPTYARNFTWPESVSGADPSRLDETTLVEYYAFKNIKLDAQLGPMAFSAENKDYNFVKSPGS